MFGKIRRLLWELWPFLCPRDDSQGALRFAPVCPSVTLYGIEFV